MSKLEEWKKTGEAPKWLDENGLKPLLKRLYRDETPKQLFERCANTAGEISQRPDLVKPWFDLMWDGILCLATPVAANLGTDRGLPISCFKTHMADTLTEDSGIYPTVVECAEMSRVGGGVGVSMDSIRPRGSKIANGGISGGVVPWMRNLDTTFDTVSQANRRGSGSVSLNIRHGDWSEFIECRDNTGDPRSRVYDLHLSTRIHDEFMHKMLAAEQEERQSWEKLLQYRWETGESYIEFHDNINRKLPRAYVDRGFTVTNTNICTEILQYIDHLHSVVCCLSSINLSIYDSYKHRFEEVVELIHRFLDAVIDEFLVKAQQYPSLRKAVRGAAKARAIGIGVLGWHDLLISKGLAFDNSWETMQLNREIFTTMQRVTDETSRKLAKEYGEPEWLQGYGERNMFKLAVAPTKSNSSVVGVEGEGIAPIVGFIYEKDSAEGKVFIKSKHLQKLLEQKGKDEYKTWKSIARNKGSVQHLDFLNDEEKKVFLTAREIDQHKLVRQAAQRQAWIDQGQSLNLWFPENATESYINSVHIEAWKLGIKTLYYLKSGPAIAGDTLDQTCESCEG